MPSWRRLAVGKRGSQRHASSLSAHAAPCLDTAAAQRPARPPSCAASSHHRHPSQPDLMGPNLNRERRKRPEDKADCSECTVPWHVAGPCRRCVWRSAAACSADEDEDEQTRSHLGGGRRSDAHRGTMPPRSLRDRHASPTTRPPGSPPAAATLGRRSRFPRTPCTVGDF